MKTDKNKLLIHGRTLVEHVLEQVKPHFDQVLLSVDDVKRYRNLDVEMVPDLVAGKGPVVGIISALTASKHGVNFVQACDIPYTDLMLVRRMLDRISNHQVVLPRNSEGQLEPLFAVYTKSAMDALQLILSKEKGRAHKIAVHCNTGFVSLQPDQKIVNLNTIADYRAYLEKLT